MTRFIDSELAEWLADIRNSHQSPLGRALLDLRDARREIAALHGDIAHMNKLWHEDLAGRDAIIAGLRAQVAAQAEEAK